MIYNKIKLLLVMKIDDKNFSEHHKTLEGIDDYEYHEMY